MGSGEAEWRRIRLGELAPDRSFGDNERAGSGDLPASSEPSPGDMLEEVWGREALDPLLYGSETARRRRPTNVSKCLEEYEMQQVYIPLSGGVKASESKFEGFGGSKLFCLEDGANSTLISGGTIC